MSAPYKILVRQSATSQRGVVPSDGNDLVGTRTYQTKEEMMTAQRAIAAEFFSFDDRDWGVVPDGTPDEHYVHTVELLITGGGTFHGAKYTMEWDIGIYAWDVLAAAVHDAVAAAGLRPIG